MYNTQQHADHTLQDFMYSRTPLAPILIPYAASNGLGILHFSFPDETTRTQTDTVTAELKPSNMLYSVQQTPFHLFSGSSITEPMLTRP